MIRTLLIRGMLVGVVAGLLAFAFAHTFGEPPVDAAIAVEESHSHSHDHAAMSMAADAAATPVDPAAVAAGAPAAQPAAEEELVSRPVQSTIGLFTGVVVYSAAFGGLFAIVFALVWGRMGSSDPRVVAAVLALVAFIVMVAVPQLKYPANPPAVGDADTIGIRTGMFWLMILGSFVAALLATFIQRGLSRIYGTWNATLVAGAAFVVVVTVVMLLLPTIDEVGADFPAAVLWQFRIASLGTQAVMWATIGILFGLVTQRALRAR
ncbi:MAG: CbtA family protein [Rhizobiales bacterium]|nr:CbtA family protein [Hyphomicrobiales bacterium]